MSLRLTYAVGYDVVLPIDPATYTHTEDAAGQVFGFDMDSERENIASAVRTVLDRPEDVERLEIEPGYLRLQIAPLDSVKPKTLLETLQSVPSEYNRQYATKPQLDALAFGTDRYIGTYRPENGFEQKSFLDRQARSDGVPESDGAVFTYRRDNAGEPALKPNRRLWYRVILPFDPEMYEQTRTFGGTDDPPVRWDEDAVQDGLRVAVEDLPAWPGRRENTPLVAVHPGYLLVEHATAGLIDDPEQLAGRIQRAFGRYNRYRNVDEEHSTRNEQQLHPAIEFSGEAYVATLDASRTATDWIRDHDLEAVDGEPTSQSEPTEPDGDDMEGGFWDAVARW